MDTLIDDYINGKEIDSNLLEQLEDNKLFMEHVIDKSNDYKMYYYASDKVKSDAGFVKFLMKRFTNKIDFLCEITDFYFDNRDDDYYSIEIAIIMCKILESKKDDRYMKYELMKSLYYTSIRLQVELAKKLENENKEFQHDLGIGFTYLFDIYKNNEIIMNFYAEKMLNELFVDDYYALDRILHKKYSSREKVEENGVYNTIINIINIYDESLASYVCTHKQLLKKVINKFYNALKRWDKYVDIYEYKKFEEVYEKILEYREDNEQNEGALTIKDILAFVGIQLGIEEKLIQYELIDEVDVDIANEDLKDYIANINTSFLDKLNYINIKNIVKKVLFSSNVSEDIEDNEKIKGAILSLEKYRKMVKLDNNRKM